MNGIRSLALAVLAAALAGACTGSVRNNGSNAASAGNGGAIASSGTGSARPDGSATGGGDAGTPLPVVHPSVMVTWPGQMVLDGTSLVVTSLDRDSGVGSLVRVTPGSWKTTTLAGGTPGTSVGHALAADAQRFYYFASDGQGNAAVYALPRAGGAPAKIADVGTPVGDAGTASQVFTSGAIAVGASRVYWTELGADPTQPGGSVRVAPLAGGPAVTLATIDAPEVPSGGLAVDASSVYWTTNTFQQTLLGSVYAMPVAGGAAARLLTDVTPIQVTSDGAFVYVLDQGTNEGDCALNSGSLTRIPLDGGAANALNSQIYGASAFAIAGGKAYIATGVSCGGAPPQGALSSLPLMPGASLTTLATGAWQPVTVVVDGADLYVSEDAWPKSFPSEPGQPYAGGIVHVAP